MAPPAMAAVNGQRLAVADSGGSGPALLFSHGLLMDQSMFDAQVAALRARYRCITWDQRGHGASGSATGSFTFWDSAEDAVALLDHLGIARAVFVGMSQGGFVSLRAALRHPERVGALVLIDSQARQEDPALLTGYMAAAEVAEAHGFIDDVANLAAAIILGTDPAVNAHWIARWRASPPGPLPLLLEVMGAREDLTARLGEIRCPALVIHGENDAAIPVEHARELTRGLSGAEELIIIPGAGHASNLTHPAVVTAALNDFLERHPVLTTR